MSLRFNCSVFAQILEKFAAAAAVLAIAPFGASLATAQGGSAPAKLQVGASPSAPMAAQATPRTTKSASKNPTEGVQVHGLWTIDVRNPDGSLASRTKFENMLAPNATQSGTVYPGGQALLWTLLAGSANSTNSTTGSSVIAWAVTLQGNGASDTPCSFGPFFGNSSWNPALAPSCAVLSQFEGVSLCQYFEESEQNSGLPPGCGNLQVQIPTVSGTSIPNGFVLSGSVVAVQAGHISTVSTVSFAGQTGVSIQGFEFTTFALSSNAGTCGSSGNPPCAVPVQAGQTIAVTVQFLFTSAS